jgi:hypothetical protein
LLRRCCQVDLAFCGRTVGHRPAVFTFPGASPAIPGTPKLNFKSPNAMKIAQQLASQQATVLSSASSAIGRTINPEHQYQFALNAFATHLTESEAQTLRQISGVASVVPSRYDELKTNISVGLIGAPIVWSDPAPIGNKGEGAVIGMLDTGLNFSSPAFAASEDPQPLFADRIFSDGFNGPAIGYQFVNPLGQGNYFGWCNAGHYPSDANGHDPCNAKVIGSWEYVNAVAAADVSDVHDNPGANDQDNHGSHTSSTSGGNTRLATNQDASYVLTGIAPHANIVISQVCYDINNPNGSIGSACPNTGSIDAVEEAIKEGVVDVISYSIGPQGGDTVSPWNDPGQMAFLSAVDSGIFVSVAAGNDGPAASTISNQGPWNATVAATTTSRLTISKILAATGPGTPPANVTSIFAAYQGGAAFTTAFPGTTPLMLSPGFVANTSGSDGCMAYTAGKFANAIAVIQRGTCPFTQKQMNAANAGAIAVIIANNRATSIGTIATVAGLPIPVFTISQADGLALNAFATSNSNASTAALSTTGFPVPGSADQVASFSSRGPTSQVNVLKPDLGAPGVDILASFAGAATSVGEDSGTSMATPHIAGSAALVHVAHPTWSPPETKSALMLTAVTTGLTTQQANGSTPVSTPTDVGAGRVQVDKAVMSGLVMNELGVNFASANPAQGGDPRTLNLASIYDQNCLASCDFPRTFTGSATAATTWTLTSTIGVGATVTATPTSFVAFPGAGTQVAFHVDTSAATTAGWIFGQITLTPSDNSPVLHLPVAVNISAQQIQVSSAPITASVAAGASTTKTLTIGNVGGLPLHWTIQSSGNAEVEPMAQNGNNNNGFSSFQTLGDAKDNFTADDVSLYGSHKLEFIVIDGFTQPPVKQLATATSVTFKVYSDAAGMPAGNPAAGAAGEIYSCTRTTASSATHTAQLDVVGAAAAGCPAQPTLSGKYWISVYATFPGNSTGTGSTLWYREQSVTGSDSTPVSISPSQGNTAWAALTDNLNNPINGLAMDIFTNATCGATWLSVAPTSGTVNAASSGTATVTLDATILTAGTYNANICVNSDDPNSPALVAPVVLTVQ